MTTPNKETGKQRLICTLAKLESLNKMMQEFIPDDGDSDMYIIENGLAIQRDMIVQAIEEVEECSHD